MGDVPIPEREEERLRALHSYEILDSLPEQAYEDMVLLAAQIAETPIAYISFVDRRRQWLKARRGLAECETARDEAFCAHTVATPARPLLVKDARLDERFRNNPAVVGSPGLRFYVGAPLLTDDGLAVGTICAADTKPRKLLEGQVRALEALSRQVMRQLDLRLLVRELKQTKTALEVHQEQLEVANERLEEESTTDALTGLENRRAFTKTLAQEYARAQRYKMPFSLMLADIDKFKEFNDTYGHPAGDEALKTTAEILDNAVRGTDRVCRYGGEEFAAILVNTDVEDAHVLTERMRRKVEAHPWPRRPITLSMGLAAMQHAATPDLLVEAADKALYAAKEQGRNRVVVASGEE